MTIRLNPFAIVDHNQHRWPRVAFHAAHVAIGLPVWLLARWVAMPLAWVLLAATVLALLDKCVWFDWRGRRIEWTGFDITAPHDWADFTSDLGLTWLGALLPPLWIALPIYYVLSLANGT